MRRAYGSKKIDSLLAVIHSGSITQAAQRLDYTQPALTQMMNSLERELGCRLLARDYSGVSLTAEGQRLLPYIEQASEALRRLRGEAEQIAAGQHRVLRLAAYPSVTKSVLSTLIREFQICCPGISIKIQIGGYDIPGWLHAGEIDIAFVDEQIRGHYNWLPLVQDPYLAVIPENCPLRNEPTVTMEQLSNYPMILSDLKELQPLTQRYSIGNRLHIDATDDATLLALVAQGLGVTVLQESSLCNLPGQVRTAPLMPALNRTLGVAYGIHLSEEGKRFIRFVRRWIVNNIPSQDATHDKH